MLQDFGLLMHEAAGRLGVEQDWSSHPETIARIMEWRTSLSAAAAKRYVRDIRSRVIDTYDRARVRGFFDPQLEDSHTTKLLIAVETAVLPGLRRVLSRQDHPGSATATPQ